MEFNVTNTLMGIVILLLGGFCGFVSRNQKETQKELTDFKLWAANSYSSKQDYEKLHGSLHEVQQEMKSMLEILYEVRADIRAGNLNER